MVGLYDLFVKDKSITPIEELPQEEKMKLTDECREMKIQYTNETLITQCKILHLIKEINNNS